MLAEKRQDEARRMLSKYDNRVPVIVVRHGRSTLPDIEQKKFLVPNELTGETRELSISDSAQLASFN